MFPLSVSNPALVLMRLPLEFNAPLKLPSPRVSAVPSSVTTPEPNRVAISTVLLAKFTNPFAVSTLVIGKNEPLVAFNVAPLSTVRLPLARTPVLARVSTPEATFVEPT